MRYSPSLMTKRFATHASAVALALSSVLVGGGASAQTGGFALDKFDPSERGSHWFVADSMDFRGKLRGAIGIVESLAYKPLVAYNLDGSERSALVKMQLTSHLGGSLVVADRFRFGVDIPFYYQQGDGGTIGGVNYDSPKSTAFGDVRIGADVGIIGTFGDPFTLGAGLRAFLPTGSRDAFAGDGKLRIGPHVTVAGTVSSFVYSASIGTLYRAQNDGFAGTPTGSELSFQAAAGLRILDTKLVIGPEIYGTTLVSGDALFKRLTTPAEVIFGGHYTAGAFRVGLGFGPGLTRGLGSPQFRALLSLEWAPPYEEAVAAPSVGDRDGDGVLDDADACIDVPGKKTSDPKTNGCPADRDKDGIEDEEDSCPDVPGVKTSDPKTNGCPPDKDKDKDGIEDQVDACPEVPGPKDPDPKKNGCPPDRDGDGIQDDRDACPDVPGVKTDDPATHGCPPDKDKDGVLDPEDACPDDPGPKDPDPKKNGCPAVIIVQGQLKILEQVKFKTGSAVILPESDAILSAVAKTLTAHAEITKLRVEGHTDNKGSPAANMTLSKNRAASVMAWLVKHGIDKKRLTSAGFGQDKPIDSNTTEEGRKNNRRVEFHIEE